MATRLSKEAQAARRAKALKLFDEGVDRGSIAERLGVKRATINAWVNAAKR